MGATMNRILAMVDQSPVAPRVLTTAAAVAGLLHCEVDAVTAVSDESERPPGATATITDRHGGATRIVHGDPEAALMDELAAPDVIVGVLGTRTLRSHPHLLGHVAHTVVTGTSTPLVLVPPDSRPLTAEHPVFLVPLDGTRRTSDSVNPIAAMLTAEAGENITLHVFDSTTVPMFAPSRHGSQLLAEEFMAQHASGTAQRAEARIGAPAQHILEVAHQHHVDAIVLAWSQSLEAGRAEVIRRVISEAEVPVVLATCR
jgi:nucleotide-binding universal stress UspA family protein